MSGGQATPSCLGLSFFVVVWIVTVPQLDCQGQGNERYLGQDEVCGRGEEVKAEPAGEEGVSARQEGEEVSADREAEEVSAEQEEEESH